MSNESQNKRQLQVGKSQKWVVEDCPTYRVTGGWELPGMDGNGERSGAGGT